MNKRLLLRPILIFVVVLSLIVIWEVPVRSQPQALALQGQQLYRQGELSQAVRAWQKAAAAFGRQGNQAGKQQSLINQAQALQELGLYPRACQTLLQSFSMETASCGKQKIRQLLETLELQETMTVVEGVGLRSLGNIIQKMQMLESAHKLLQLSKQATLNSSELGATLLALGNVQRIQGNRNREHLNFEQATEVVIRQDPSLAWADYTAAFRAYKDVAALPSASLLIKIQAQINHLSLLGEIKTWWQEQTTRRIASWQRVGDHSAQEIAQKFLESLAQEIDPMQANLILSLDQNLSSLPPSHQGIYAQLNYVQSLNRLGQTDKTLPILQRTLQQAQQIKDQSGICYALGYLGQLYGQQGWFSEGIALTNQALAQAQKINRDTREIRYLWQAQLGKFWEQEGQTESAIIAYKEAYRLLQSLRTDLNAINELVQLDFRQEVKPVYLHLANLLLSHETSVRSKSLSKKDTKIPSSKNLELVRQVIESLQLAELDNFFQDPCSQTASFPVTIDQLDPHAAVIYPILLEDRLEVIISLPGKPLRKIATPVASQVVNQTLDSLFDTLYSESINNSAVNIFSTIPLDSQELKENTATLLPILQQIYSWLIEPWTAELTNQQIQTLVFVMSDRLQNIPVAALYDGHQYLIENYGVALAPSLQLLDVKPTPRAKLKVLAAGLSQQVEVAGEIFPALANVPQELAQIQAIFPQSRQLLNQDFTASRLSQQLRSGYPIIHLATHGVFSSNPEQTFIVTGNQQTINLEEFSTILNANGLKSELIVLSACDTATGDEKAALGLAGVAVRSSSSTVASLWSIEDESTSKLMNRFYQELEHPEAKKVDALRQGQLSLLKSWREEPPAPGLEWIPPHPYAWASYVLVGNWR